MPKSIHSSKTALVTGASEGIGRAFAQHLANKNYKIVAVARNEQRLQELMKELPGEGHRYLRVDLSTESGAECIAHELQNNTNHRYDLLVNNAGFGAYGNFSETSLTTLHEMIRLNCSTVVTLSHAFLNQAQPGAALINVASVLAYLPFPNNALYAASKAFVESLSDALWYEQKSKNVYVMALCPGYTKTLFNKRAGGKDKQIPNYYAQTPDDVVLTALKALSKRKTPVVISGTKNLAMTQMGRVLPRTMFISWAVKMAGKYIKKVT